MAPSAVAELRAIWLVWSRQQLARYRFWLQVAGLDIRNLSWASSFYLIYVLLFLVGWAFAMLALLAHGTSTLLLSLAPNSPDTGATILLAIVLACWALLELYRSSRRSPFMFSPEDALLLCQTPVSRRAVALAWFITHWIEVVLPFGLAVLVLESGVVGLQVGGSLEAGDLLRYILEGLRGLTLLIPWQTAMLALAWAAGAHRLQGDRDRPGWRWAAPLIVLILGVGIVWSRGDARLSQVGQALLWPLLFPLRAAFGQGSWAPAVLVAFVLSALGVGALFVTAGGLNLSRAAQETSRLAAQQQAVLLGATAFAKELARQDRLGSGRHSTIWPVRPGAWALMWKDLVQSTRPLSLGSLTSWLLVLSLSTGAVLTPEWGTRVGVAAFWTLTVGQQTAARLRSDLARWWLWRQLPLPFGQLLLAETARPIITAVLMTWVGLGAGSMLASRGSIAIFWLIPTAVSSIACAAVLAIVWQSHNDTLLAEQVPSANELAFVLGLLCIAAMFGIVAWFAHQHWPLWIGVTVALVVGLACVAGLWHLTVRAYAHIA